MPEQRLFHAPNVNINQLSHALADFYRSQKFDVQLLDAPGGGSVIQARQEEVWRTALGMSAALNILLRHQQDGNLLVEIGAGKWMDKAAAAGVGVFILWPMLFTAGFGAWQQSQLPQRTFDFIQNFIATGGSLSADIAMMQASQYNQARQVVGGMSHVGAAPGVTPSPTYAGASPSTYTGAPFGSPAPAGNDPARTAAEAELGSGGSHLTSSAFCMSCGARLPEGAKFCPGCGTKAS